MATHASAAKAARQSEKRRVRNQAARSNLRSMVKKVRTELLSKKAEGKEIASASLQTLLSQVQRVLMKAASKNLIKKRTASRTIARLNQAANRYLRKVS